MQNTTPQQEESQDLSDILSAPLLAAASANSKLAMTQTMFMLDNCFSEEGDAYKPIMVKMALTRTVIVPGNPESGEPDKIENHTTTFDLPLLTILPLNSLAIDKVDLNFDVEVTGFRESGDKGSQIFGRISKDASNCSTLSVAVNAMQAPLPKGVTTIIEAFTHSISPISEPLNNP